MHIVSDFDGVWTDPRAEAAAFGAEQERVVAAALGVSSAAARERLAPVRAAVRAAPHAHGWTCTQGGALSCFADEDPYVFHNAVAEAIWQAEDRLRAALEAAGHSCAAAFALACFEAGTARWRARAERHLLPEAIEAVRALLAAGHVVTIVSNSSTERLCGILGRGDLEWEAHPRLRLRGDARKFELSVGAQAPVCTLARRPVRIDRPRYLRLLEALRPDVVIGDNVSLDLALPLWLRERAGWARKLRVVLKHNPYTPAWAEAACWEAGASIVSSLEALCDRVA